MFFSHISVSSTKHVNLRVGSLLHSSWVSLIWHLAYNLCSINAFWMKRWVNKLVSWLLGFSLKGSLDAFLIRLQSRIRNQNKGDFQWILHNQTTAQESQRLGFPGGTASGIQQGLNICLLRKRIRDWMDDSEQNRL